MAFATSTEAERQALYEVIVNASKMVTVATQTGAVDHYGPGMDNTLAALKAAITATEA